MQAGRQAGTHACAGRLPDLELGPRRRVELAARHGTPTSVCSPAQPRCAPVRPQANHAYPPTTPASQGSTPEHHVHVGKHRSSGFHVGLLDVGHDPVHILALGGVGRIRGVGIGADQRVLGMGVRAGDVDRWRAAGLHRRVGVWGGGRQGRGAGTPQRADVTTPPCSETHSLPLA